jgi:peptide deformylase
MILPIVAYGDSVLKEVADSVAESDQEEVQELVDNMFETMYNASGVGLAAPQVNRSWRIFVVDTHYILKDDDDTEEEGIKQAFINPEIVETSDNRVTFEEGCLSIPQIRENVDRSETVTMNYLDTDFEEHQATFDGFTGRVILHEYDHIEGVLFTDHLSTLRRKMLKKRLTKIAKGEVDVDYKMSFPLASQKKTMRS